MKITLPSALNGLLLLFPFFLLFHSLLSLLPLENGLKIAFAILFSIITSLLFLTVSSSKNEKKSAYKSIIDEDKRYLNYLSSLSEKEAENLFQRLFEKLKIAAKNIDDGIMIGEVLIFPLLFPEDLSLNDGAKIAKKIKGEIKKTVIISSSFSKELTSRANDYALTLLETEKILPLLKENKLLPPLEKTPKVKKIHLENLLLKTNSNKLIFYGVIMLLMSKIAFYPVYYIISGSAFFLFGLFTKFLGKKPIEKSDLDDFLKDIGVDGNKNE